jgi:hypothetical protein
MKDNPMKNLSLIILIAGLGAGCWKQENAEAGKPKPNPPAVGPQELIASPIVENSIRQQLKKPKGELTQADLEKVTELDLFSTPKSPTRASRRWPNSSSSPRLTWRKPKSPTRAWKKFRKHCPSVKFAIEPE